MIQKTQKILSFENPQDVQPQNASLTPYTQNREVDTTGGAQRRIQEVENLDTLAVVVEGEREVAENVGIGVDYLVGPFRDFFAKLLSEYFSFKEIMALRLMCSKFFTFLTERFHPIRRVTVNSVECFQDQKLLRLYPPEKRVPVKMVVRADIEVKLAMVNQNITIDSWVVDASRCFTGSLENLLKALPDDIQMLEINKKMSSDTIDLTRFTRLEKVKISTVDKVIAPSSISDIECFNVSTLDLTKCRKLDRVHIGIVPQQWKPLVHKECTIAYFECGVIFQELDLSNYNIVSISIESVYIGTTMRLPKCLKELRLQSYYGGELDLRAYKDLRLFSVGYTPARTLLPKSIERFQYKGVLCDPRNIVADLVAKGFEKSSIEGWAQNIEIAKE